MSTFFTEAVAVNIARTHAWRISRERALELLALAAIVALATILRFANLDALGDANHYYTAAVKAMLESWHNFFFAAAEPGGSVSVDKPPVGLWFQVISAYFFGVNGLGVLLPQIIAGIMSVVVVYHLVRKSFGAVAGLLAGLALAVTPVVVATDRNNTMDSTLILTLLLAAWAFIIATERGKLRYLMLGAILVGVGFNIKMLEAYLPLPAFYALYFLGSPERLWRKAINLALMTMVLIAVSLSWATVVDLTPEDQRPYVGSSSDNSELNLITGYNGLNRLLGMDGRGNILSQLFGGNQSNPPRDGAPGQMPGGAFQPPQGQMRGDALQQRQAMPPPPQGFQPPQGGPDGGPGGFNIGQPGAWRLFTAPLSKEASWLLIFGLFSAILLAFRARPQRHIAPKHQAAVLWCGWLLTGAVFFSVAGFFHEYYLAILGAPIAALVGIGLSEVWQIRAQHPWIAFGLIVIAASATLGLQIVTANAFVRTMWWLPIVIGLFGVGIALLLPWRKLQRVARIGFVCVVAALLLTPTIWSALTVLYSSGNQSLPSAYDGRSAGPPNMGQMQVNQALLDYLQMNTQGVKYLLAVPSSMQGADYVLATGRPVLYLGGFNGNDRVVSSAELQAMVANHELRFIYYDARGGGTLAPHASAGVGGPDAMQSDISSWVTSACAPVGFNTTTQNFGAPDGTARTANAGAPAFGPGGSGGMQVSLYDCAQGAK